MRNNKSCYEDKVSWSKNEVENITRQGFLILLQTFGSSCLEQPGLVESVLSLAGGWNRLGWALGSLPTQTSMP